MSFLAFALLAVHALLLYAWVLYPLLLAYLSKKWPRPVNRPAEDRLPLVAFVLSAYNEEAHIAERIRNLLALDYPAARWQAYVGVDGSSDRTESEARSAATGHANVTVVKFAENRGKVAVLKDLVAQSYGGNVAPEILVFTDANTVFATDALRRLAAPFSDPAVGGVCGMLLFRGIEDGETQEGLYWWMENWLKKKESALDSCLGANGAIYAIRVGLFWKAIPANTIIDDFVIGMKVRERGYRMVYEPGAVAVEHLPAKIKDEWKRRVRIGAGDFQALRMCGACLKPSFGAFAWVFWSHKVLRWLTPHLMIAGTILAATAAIAARSLSGWAFLASYIGFAALVLLGHPFRRHKGRMAKILRGVRYLFVMQAAIFIGFLRFCRGNLEGRWQRTARG
jgi:cellulose synthase/poly-beta-1,6-N-acetylglucosamine synthase-like glycosyltransferase